MQDRVPLYPGRVKLVPVAGQDNTYDMVRADQPTQDGTPLNKDSLLKDTTASLYGLGVDAVPDDVLKLLSRFNSGLGNEYLWAKKEILTDVVYGTEIPLRIIVNGKSETRTYYYSENVDANGLVSPNVLTLTYSTGKNANILKGKYYSELETGTGSIWFVKPDAEDADVGYSGGTYGVRISSKPVTITVNYGNTEYLNSDDDRSYPTGESNGFMYDKFGKIGSKSKLIFGSYIGTGTGPVQISFDFDISVFSIVAQKLLNGNTTIFQNPYTTFPPIYPRDLTAGYGLYSSGAATQSYGAYADNTLRWSNLSNDYFNQNGVVYYFIGAG